jgi:hypothetical protein
MLAFLFFFCGWQETCRIFVHKKQKKQQGTEQNARQRGSYNFERKQSIKSNTNKKATSSMDLLISWLHVLLLHSFQKFHEKPIREAIKQTKVFFAW